MKSFVIASALVAAAAHAPPRIELDLVNTDHAGALYKLDQTIDRTPCTGDGAKTSQQEYTVKCPGGPKQTASHASTCPLPHAKAYDHHDDVTAVTTRVYLVDLDNQGTAGFSADGFTEQSDASTCTDGIFLGEGATGIGQINYEVRSTYLIKYDAKDRAENHAGQMVVALVIDDTLPPTVDVQCQTSSSDQTLRNLNSMDFGNARDNSGNTAKICQEYSNDYIEAGSNWQMNCDSTAYDTFDKNHTNLDIKYSIQNLATGADVAVDVNCTQARAQLNTNTVTNYLITLRACDHAGVYGYNHQDNCASYYQTIRMRDSLKPWINVHGGDPYLHECAEVYDDEHATCLDQLDTQKLNRVLNVTAMANDSGGTNKGALASQIFGRQPDIGSATAAYDNTDGEYVLNYNCVDAHDNHAAQKTRTVKVIDTRAPVMSITCANDIHHEQNGVGSNSIDDQLAGCSPTCSDACDPSTTYVGEWRTMDTQFGNWTTMDQFSETTEKAQKHCWICTDKDGNKDTACVTVYNEDMKKPILTIQGEQTHYVEASLSDVYTDMGATCEDTEYSDAARSNLNDRVKISGSVVNMRVPEKYEIVYNCMDSSGNAADEVTRTVIVKDTTAPPAPTLDMEDITIEAGFPYVDRGATVIDNLDGDIPFWENPTTKTISSNWTVTGDQVNDQNSYSTATDCIDIKDQKIIDGSTATNGQYYVTRKSAKEGPNAYELRGDGTNGNAVTHNYAHYAYQRVLVTCNFGSAVPLTWKDIDGRVPHTNIEAISAYGSEDGECNFYGMKMASKTLAEEIQNTGDSQITFSYDSVTDEYVCVPTTGAEAITSSEITSDIDPVLHCSSSSTDCNTDTSASHFNMVHNSLQNGKAQPGKYIITYSAHDAHWNTTYGQNSITNYARRTVTVVDTLPPVITLKLDSAVIQVSDYKQHPSQSTPSQSEIKNPAGSALNIVNPTPTQTHASMYGNPFLEGEEVKYGYSYDGDADKDDSEYTGNFMAEEQASASNAWVIGAVASAVTGVALLGYSAKKQTATSVPV